MASKLRVFISSTVKDLANERDAVIRKVEEFNFEPVNAEGWLPSGSKSWGKIDQELRSSHMFVLILGDRYGWIPDHGPGADDGFSVTHMEFNAARKMEIPILPFLKRLDYDSPRDTDDAKKRDEFIKEVSRWESGHFISEFVLASDLSRKIGATLVEVLSETYLNVEVKKRTQVATQIHDVQPKFRAAPITFEREFLNSINEGQAILLAGAGMSLIAGYPSAMALAELLLSKIAEDQGHNSVSSLNVSFQEIAEYYALAYGRTELNKVLNQGLHTPQDVQPTEAHLLSVQLFKTILTTNYDCLFEQACDLRGLDCTVITGNDPVPEECDKVTIVKLDGSLSDPESLIVTLSDGIGAQYSKPKLWQSLFPLMGTRTLVTVGHSLRDISTKSLLDKCPSHLLGYFVGYHISSFDKLQLKGRGLIAIDADANSFFRELGKLFGLDVGISG